MTTIKEIFPNIFEINFNSKKIIVTKNLTPGSKFYGERLIEKSDKEYRSWAPYRSKLAAALVKGLKHFPINPGNKVLYLGVASGTTCSHISDIVELDGHIWGVEFAPRPFRDLVDKLARYRVNISPVLADARRPESYSALIPKVNVIYADVAQPNQSAIMIKNSEIYLKNKGWAVMAIKSRSIDVTKTPKNVYAEELEKLKSAGFDVIEIIDLSPFVKDHAITISRYSG
jgi:fibrillarin-like pre-rRNA processing protein